MSIQAMQWALSFEAENATEKAILLVIANYSDGNGRSYPGQQNIAVQASSSERTVRRVLESLEARGIIAREERRRKDGSRTSDIIVLSAFQQADKLAGSDEANRPSCPNQPATMSGLTSFEPSEEPSAAAACEKSDLESLTDRLIEAAGEKIQPHGAIILAPILGLIDAGCDLETDILPTIRARTARMTRPASSWAYFVAAIRDAYEARIAAGRGLAKPKAPPKRDDERTADELRDTWRKRLEFARPRDRWITWQWGPPPGQAGCRVPSDMLTERDVKRNWSEVREAEAA